MAHTLEQDQDKGLIRVFHYGQVNREDIWGSQSSMLGVLGGAPEPRIFVDMQQTRLSISKYEGYEFSVNLARNLPPESRVAMVKLPNGDHDSDLMFMKTVCERNGLRMRLFNDREEAERWLLE